MIKMDGIFLVQTKILGQNSYQSVSYGNNDLKLIFRIILLLMKLINLIDDISIISITQKMEREIE
jgi:hypothetical protein